MTRIWRDENLALLPFFECLFRFVGAGCILHIWFCVSWDKFVFALFVFCCAGFSFFRDVAPLWAVRILVSRTPWSISVLHIGFASVPGLAPRYQPQSHSLCYVFKHSYTHTHTHTCLTALFPGLPRWASTRKVKPIWILLKQETVSGSGISWAVCKSASCSRQTITANTSPLCFLQAGCPFCHPTNSVKRLKALKAFLKTLSLLTLLT